MCVVRSLYVDAVQVHDSGLFSSLLATSKSTHGGASVVPLPSHYHSSRFDRLLFDKSGLLADFIHSRKSWFLPESQQRRLARRWLFSRDLLSSFTRNEKPEIASSRLLPMFLHLKAAFTERISTWDAKDLTRRGIPTQRVINVYEKWDHGGFGVILTGNICVDPVS